MIYFVLILNLLLLLVSCQDIITTIAGSSTSGSGGDNGQATSASLNSPVGIALDSSGMLLLELLLLLFRDYNFYTIYM
jgi:hypothetical protein